MTEPTEKQINRVAKIVAKLGEHYVEGYLHYFYPTASLNNLEKHHAQKIITGLGHRIAPPVTGVAGRDRPWL